MVHLTIVSAVAPIRNSVGSDRNWEQEPETRGEMDPIQRAVNIRQAVGDFSVFREDAVADALNDPVETCDRDDPSDRRRPSASTWIFRILPSR